MLQAEKGKLEPAERHSMQQLTKPLMDAVHQAFGAHDIEKEARAAAAGGG